VESAFAVRVVVHNLGDEPISNCYVVVEAFQSDERGKRPMTGSPAQIDFGIIGAKRDEQRERADAFTIIANDGNPLAWELRTRLEFTDAHGGDWSRALDGRLREIAAGQQATEAGSSWGDWRKDMPAIRHLCRSKAHP